MPEIICKTICQHNSAPVPPEVMDKLQEVAKDYRAVKAYVYQRYGGIYSLSKLYPGFTVQNEMTRSGLKEELGIPSVYFYLAIFDALGNIKANWSLTKNKIRGLANKNPHLSKAAKHYLRFLLKTDKAFAGVLMQKPPEAWELPETILNHYYGLAQEAGQQKKGENKTDRARLNRYLCRQARKCYVRPRAGTADGFSLSKSTCRYGDHGIYISTKEKRKRVFIPLTDGNTYTGQFYLKLFPEENRIELKVPVRITARSHPDYTNQVGVSLGTDTMLVTHEGRRYGDSFGEYRENLAEFIRIHGETGPQSGKKRCAGAARLREHLKTYVNQELNRFLKREKPGTIYLPKLPQNGNGAYGASFGKQASTELYGTRYVRNRLLQKCREHSVQIITDCPDKREEDAFPVLPQGLDMNS